jgi:AcrR family transcriptional regulator
MGVAREQGALREPAEPAEAAQPVPAPAVAARRPRRRRKEARPEEILEAALAEFAEKGYAATRLEDVARRAGIAKGTIYLYFPGKAPLFKAVVRRAVLPQFEDVQGALQAYPGSTEEFLRGPFRMAMGRFVRSEARRLAPLLIAEGRGFPDLTEFVYRELVQRGISLLRQVVARGEARGEFRHTNLNEFPQPLIAAAFTALIWQRLFEDVAPIDVDRLLETHIDLILDGLKKRTED